MGKQIDVATLADARKGVAALRVAAGNRRSAGSPMGDALDRYADALDEVLHLATPAPDATEARGDG